MKKYKIIAIIFIILTLISVIMTISMLEKSQIAEVSKAHPKQENPKDIVWDYRGIKEEKAEVLVTLIDTEGEITKIETPNGETINVGYKNKVGIDYAIEFNTPHTFKMYNKDGEIYEEDIILDMSIFIYEEAKEYGYTKISIDYIQTEDVTYKQYYKIGETGEWQEYKETFYLWDYDVACLGLTNNDETVTVYGKLEDEYGITTEVSKKIEVDSSIKDKITTIEAESLYSAIKQINENGIFQVNIEDETYNLHMYVFFEDITFGYENNLYKFGNKTEISQSKTEKAKNTIVVKSTGNIKIENGATIQPVSGNFGGPKGLIIYTDYKLSMNNGSIKNTTGCNADSQNIYLYKNNDNSYEMISKDIVSGGTGQKISKGKGRGSSFLTSPQKGKSGTGRQTGGGGAGYAAIGNNSNNGGNLNATSGSGSSGTSWSGGAGGGGAALGGNGNSATIVAGNAYSCIAGDAACHGYGYDYTVYVSGYGGSGNAAGKGYYCQTGGTAKWGSLNTSLYGKAGVGGVIAVYCDTLDIIESSIMANGTSSEVTYGKAYISSAAASANSTTYAGGGGSGGGSVNVFYNNISNNLDENLIIDILGRGTGGNGTYNIGNISSGKYESLKSSN